MKTAELVAEVQRILGETTLVADAQAEECARNAVAGYDPEEGDSLADCVMEAVAHRRANAQLYPWWMHVTDAQAQRVRAAVDLLRALEVIDE